MCKCVQLPASAQRGTKKKSVDGVVAERKGRGSEKEGAIFMFEDGSTLRGRSSR